MEDLLKQLLEGQQQLLARVSNIKSSMVTKEELIALKNTVENINGQIDETNQITRSLLHRSEELDAKYHC
jgi:hypothetical protein